MNKQLPKESVTLVIMYFFVSELILTLKGNPNKLVFLYLSEPNVVLITKVPVRF